MKTTLELPDALMRRVKVRAANTDRKLKDVVTDLIEQGLREQPVRSRAPTRVADWNEILEVITDGRYAHFKSQDEVNAWMDELRADRDDVAR
jgi:plasmid stability protein